jgi:cation transport regulator ChaC
MIPKDGRKVIFGFGSLLSLDSLQASAPDVIDVLPAYIHGFKRDFSLWDPIGFSKTNLDVAGIPFCALDLNPSLSSKVRVNGVVFTVSDSSFKDILEREREYRPIKTNAYDFISNEIIGECLLFSAAKNNGTYHFGSRAQARYLQICLKGAEEHGEKFYKEFLETTFINGKPLSKVDFAVL